MSIEAQPDNLNQDGSITIKIDGKDIKFVKESDLGAVKGALKDKDGEVSKLQASLATANTKYDESHQEVLKERAAREAVEKDAQESATFKTRVGELETELAGHKESSGKLTEKLTEQTRSRLVDGFKIDAEKIKDMALEDLEKTEANLLLVGAKPAPANFDGKAGGGTITPSDLQGKGPLALATMAYEESEKKR